MTESTAIIPVVYQDGVFVPQADVSHLAEGTSIDITIPAPDEWDLLLEEITSEADDETAELTRGRWDALDAGRRALGHRKRRMAGVEPFRGPRAGWHLDLIQTAARSSSSLRGPGPGSLPPETEKLLCRSGS